MLEYASPLPLVAPAATSRAHSSTRGQTTTGATQPTVVTDDTAAAFLARAMERARPFHGGAVFSVTFSDEPPSSPGQVLRLIGMMQRLSASYGLRYQRCDGWDFTFKKLATTPGP